MRWFLSIALALALQDGAGAQTTNRAARADGERRGFFSFFTDAGRNAAGRTFSLSPQDIGRIIRGDHNRAEALLERDRLERQRFYQELGEQRRAAWQTRWAIRDEAVARNAEERARERQRAAERQAPEAPSIAAGAPGLVRRLLDQPVVQDAGQTVGEVLGGVSDELQERLLRPLQAQSERMSSGHYALLLAGVFFVPSLGVASLILGFINLRARFLRRGVLFLLLAGLCTAAVASALHSPLVQPGIPRAAVLLPEKLEVAGRVYEGVRYTGHDTRRLNFEHAGGAGSVALGDLPEAWQVELGYDPARAAQEDARTAQQAARSQKLRAIKADGIPSAAIVVHGADGGFVIAEIINEKSGAPLATGPSGCAFLATGRQDLRSGAPIRVTLYPFGERRAKGGWGMVEPMPAYTDSAERLLASAEEMD